jgi:hypothetical protein
VGVHYREGPLKMQALGRLKGGTGRREARTESPRRSSTCLMDDAGAFVIPDIGGLWDNVQSSHNLKMRESLLHS